AAAGELEEVGIPVRAELTAGAGGRAAREGERRRHAATTAASGNGRGGRLPARVKARIGSLDLRQHVQSECAALLPAEADLRTGAANIQVSVDRLVLLERRFVVHGQIFAAALVELLPNEERVGHPAVAFDHGRGELGERRTRRIGARAPGTAAGDVARV